MIKIVTFDKAGESNLMRHKATTVFATISLIAIIGCSQNSAPNSEIGITESTSTDFSGRLKAAQEISNSGTRNEALCTLAKDAAKAGQGEIVKQTIEGIDQSTIENPTVSVAAITLAEAGQGIAAIEIASMIDQSVVANEAFSKVAIVAAKNGDAAVVKKAINEIDQSIVSNKAAAEAALEFAKAGKTDAAVVYRLVWIPSPLSISATLRHDSSSSSRLKIRRTSLASSSLIT